MAPPRLLLCGDVLGHLNQLFKRVSSVNKSTGPFDALLCVGQFFPDSSDHLGEFMDYIEGRSEIPLPTYFIGDYGASAMKVLSAATKDPANLGFKMGWFEAPLFEGLIGRCASRLEELGGLSVSYLSGRHSTSSQQFGTYSQDDIDALRAFAEEPGIVDFSAISELVIEIKPRYHVAGTKGVFYAREPYANTEAVHVTRFLGLGAVGNKDRQGAYAADKGSGRHTFLAFELKASTMSASEIGMKPTNTTLCPFTSVDKAAHTDGAAKRPIDKAPESQYWRYDVSQKRQRHGDTEGNKLCFKFLSTGSCARGEKCHFQHDGDAREQCSRGVCFDFLNKGKCERGPDCNFKHSLQDEDKSFPNRRRGSGNTSTNTDRSSDCWFCLSSFSLESHLITSIGEHYYCALAKGPLVEDHVLIIPIEHTPTTLSSSSECEPELIRFQNSLKKYFKNQEKEVVFFEWFSTRGTHANLQVIPIPSSRASVVKDIFNLAAQKLGFKFTEIKKGRKSLQMKFDRKCSLFYVELPGDTILYHSVEENETFPAQFGREVLAGLLNMADRADWKNCKLGKEEETKMAENFKNRYQEYNPNP
ncbi:CwfJ-like family protein [Actinidia rufa]|uniref:CwfJ-like family protein n=1 Tax=Actinidia rufa TaxID=165716 RepID=A0A7J0FID5_9ERIC|nr:CwfJ-like family protein [Actinidia rufa]